MIHRLNIAILGGTGKQGSGLAMRWARAGHAPVLVSRDPERAARRADELSARADAVVTSEVGPAAVAAADVVVIAVPYAAQADTLRDHAAALAGKRVLDVVVPLDPAQPGRVALPAGHAAALEAQALVPEARIAAALHHVSSAHLGALDRTLGDVLVCADDPAWLGEAISLCAMLGCRALDGGPLANSVALESMTAVLYHLDRRYKLRGAGLRVGEPGDEA